MSQAEFHELHFKKMEEIKRKISSFNQITGSDIDPETAPLIAQARMKEVLKSDEIWQAGEYSKHLQELVEGVC